MSSIDTPLPRPSVATLRMHSFGSAYARLRARAATAGIPEAESVLPAEGVIRTFDGLDLHYLEWPGSGAGPLVLLLHGGGLHAHSFDVVGLLARRFGRVVALDLRGHGESGWAGPGGYTTDHHIADIEAVVEAFGRRPVVVVAHSMSAFAALLWASRQPVELAALVVVDVGLRPDGATGRAVGEFISGRPAFADLEEAERFVGGVVAGVREAAASGVAQNLTWTSDGVLSWKHDSRQFTAAEATVPTADELGAAAQRVAVPTLVLRGDRSRVLGDDEAAELAGLVPQGRWLRVGGAGHTIQTSNPRGLVEALAAFLSDIDLIPRTDEGAPRWP